MTRSPFPSLSLSVSLILCLAFALDLLSVCTWNYFEHSVFIFVLILLLFPPSFSQPFRVVGGMCSLVSMWNQARTCFNFSKIQIRYMSNKKKPPKQHVNWQNHCQPPYFCDACRRNLESKYRCSLGALATVYILVMTSSILIAALKMFQRRKKNRFQFNSLATDLKIACLSLCARLEQLLFRVDLHGQWQIGKFMPFALCPVSNAHELLSQNGYGGKAGLIIHTNVLLSWIQDGEKTTISKVFNVSRWYCLVFGASFTHNFLRVGKLAKKLCIEN